MAHRPGRHAPLGLGRERSGLLGGRAAAQQGDGTLHGPTGPGDLALLGPKTGDLGTVEVVVIDRVVEQVESMVGQPVGRRLQGLHHLVEHAVGPSAGGRARWNRITHRVAPDGFSCTTGSSFAA